MYLASTVPESALETVEMAGAARVCLGGLEPSNCLARAPASAAPPLLQQGARCEVPSRYDGGSARSSPNWWIAQCMDEARALKRGHFAR